MIFGVFLRWVLGDEAFMREKLSLSLYFVPFVGASFVRGVVFFGESMR